MANLRGPGWSQIDFSIEPTYIIIMLLISRVQITLLSNTVIILKVMTILKRFSLSAWINSWWGQTSQQSTKSCIFELIISHQQGLLSGINQVYAPGLLSIKLIIARFITTKCLWGTPCTCVTLWYYFQALVCWLSSSVWSSTSLIPAIFKRNSLATSSTFRSSKTFTLEGVYMIIKLRQRR